VSSVRERNNAHVHANHSNRAAARWIDGPDSGCAKRARRTCDVVSFSVRYLCRTVWKQQRTRTSLYDCLNVGRQFVEAVQNHQISPEAVNSEVPIGVTMLLAGPSVDFIIGRIFENAMGDAYDNIVKQKNGVPLPVDDWVRDEEVKKSKAQLKYLQGNCELIR
jgi:hypothetical protein